jgi:hypothetical protein
MEIPSVVNGMMLTHEELTPFPALDCGGRSFDTGVGKLARNVNPC